MSTDSIKDIAVDPKTPMEDPLAKPEVRESKKPAKSKVAKMTTTKPVVHRDVPIPFRPSDLKKAIEAYAESNGLTPKQASEINPFTFSQEQGLPKVTKLFRVQGTLEGQHLEVHEIEAYDEPDAINRYVTLLRLATQSVHVAKFQVFLKSS